MNSVGARATSHPELATGIEHGARGAGQRGAQQTPSTSLFVQPRRAAACVSVDGEMDDDADVDDGLCNIDTAVVVVVAGS